MKEKILYTATTDIHLLSFHIPYLEWFKSQGYEVHVAFKGDREIPFADKIWHLPFSRSPISGDNFRALKKLKAIINDNNYTLIHCHTPSGGLITRLAAFLARNSKAKVIYTSHGFHFFKGSPIKNWLIFFPVEWGLSLISDAIITINREDYNFLKDYKFQSRHKFQIQGIGIDPKRLEPDVTKNKEQIREDLDVKKSDIVILYIAEFIDRKNHKFVIEALPKLIEKNTNIHLLFAGGGELKEIMQLKAKNLGVDKHISFLGFRRDIGNIIQISDIGISASKQEGLGLGVAEMMYNNIPVVVSEDRGHKELVKHGENGLMYAQNDSQSFVRYIMKLIQDQKFADKLRSNGKASIDKFLIENSLQTMIGIYEQVLNK